MVVCKFFMQGYCRYGDNCKFEHPRGGNAGYAYAAQRQLFGGGGGGGGGGSRFSGGGGGTNPFKWTANDYQKTQNKPVVQQVSPNDLINTLISEVKEWERNKMWPFSCIGFEKDSPCVPDFQDTSPEELRHLAYEAQKSNSFQGYVEYVQNLMADFSKKRQMLANANMRTKQKLLSLIDEYRLRKNRSGNSGSYNTVSLFSSSANENSSSRFGASFGGGSSQNSFDSSSFGSSGSFGSTGTQGFGASGSAGTFGAGSSSTGGFGVGTTSGSMGAFGVSDGSSGVSGSPGGFGSLGGFRANTGSSGGFGANSSSSGGFGSSGSFGVNSGSSGGFGNSGGFGANSGGFGAGTSSGGFGATFGTQPPANANLNNNAFGNSNATTTPIANANPFGNPTGSAGASFQSPQQTAAASKTYTPMDKLTAEELAEFQANQFTLGKIPTKPPPKELCF
ncbi:nucleoporin NUP42-like isoform X2 [Crassostrea angulata]|uniref:nucleoporin NUP42-like isoform X2 n=1 Tax=Magallana angulata TaxID=2784310 RepID=UPI0022B12CBD|nr:nucleoporin NUP42-like isoform X2 [Crassostrea angulata]